MRKRTGVVVALIIAAVFAAPLRPALGAEKPCYLVIASKSALPTLEPLLELRRRDYLVFTITAEELSAIGEVSIGLIKGAVRVWRSKQPSLAHVLLVGDTHPGEDGLAALPTHPTGFDTWYGVLGTDDPRVRQPALHQPAVAIGRFPASTLDELKAMVDKTVSYETQSRPGPWQRRLHAIAGTGGYTPAIDQLIDTVGTAILASEVPQTYAVTMTRGLTSSPFCWPPEDFEKRVVALFDGGALYVSYVGHGSPQSAMPVTGFARGKIMDCRTMRRLRCPAGQRPIAFFVACDMGAFDRGEDCLAEAALKAPGGPVACVASTRESHPYGNAVLGLELTRALIGGREPTLGGRMLQALCRTVSPRSSFDLLRMSMAGLSQVDALGGMTGSEQSAVLIRHVYLYCILGDPALRVASPAGAIAPFRASLAADRSAWQIEGAVAGMPRGSALVSLEMPRNVILGTLEPIDPKAPGWREAMERNYATANNKVVAQATAEVRDGQFRAALPPVFNGKPLPAGTYIIKAIAWDERASAVAATQVAWSPPN